MRTAIVALLAVLATAGCAAPQSGLERAQSDAKGIEEQVARETGEFYTCTAESATRITCSSPASVLYQSKTIYLGLHGDHWEVEDSVDGGETLP